MAAYIDLTGRTFGYWVVTGKSDTKHKFKGAVWNCLCKCGTTREVRSGSLNSGKSSSCGCGRNEATSAVMAGNRFRALSPGQAAFNNLFSAYRRRAKKIGIKFLVDKAAFKELTSGNCYYCGSPPSSKSKTVNGDFIYNGIDRVVNHLGYENGNCVSCCHKCNSIKNSVSLEMIISIYDLVFGKSKITPSPTIFDGSVHL